MKLTRIRVAVTSLLFFIIAIPVSTQAATESDVIEEVVALLEEHFWREVTVPATVKASLDDCTASLKRLIPILVSR